MSETIEPKQRDTNEHNDGEQPEDELDDMRSELEEANKKGEEYLQLLQHVPSRLFQLSPPH